MTATLELPASADPYLERYRAGVCRDRIFHDLILDHLPERPEPTFLDIGCGKGFDGDVPLQQSMAARASRMIGVEPDTGVQPGEYFHEVHRSFFEDAPIAAGSIDVAYAIMVLEHLERPQRFWDKLHEVLADGGVFWGMTVDSRHAFCRWSRWFDRLKLKDLYLNRFLGERGTQRYENYPVFYRSNSPDQVRPLARSFRSVRFWNFSRVGQCNSYVPRWLHPLMNGLDRRGIERGRPGTLLIVEARK